MNRMILLILCGLGTAVFARPLTCPWLDEPPVVVTKRVSDIDLPCGYRRIAVGDSSFAAWLRNLPLKAVGEPVRLYDGRLKFDQSVHYRVLDIDIGRHDLQQCADAVMRLAAEYLYSRKRWNDIAFDFTSGDRAYYSEWLRGKRPQVRGNSVTWSFRSVPDSSYQNFRAYLEMVFRYAGTYSLARETLPVADLTRVQAGDLFIQGGFPGHAILVVDVAEHMQSGEKLMLLAQSYMPAQNIHILNNPCETQVHPWYTIGRRAELSTPEWRFKWSDLRRWNSAFDHGSD
ncbi:MAG TPA: DUF4846 domain-containing protein [bacterium]|nr:DUF4846 domain-containing protein [bacterium]